MFLYRFMSMTEFERFTSGEILENDKVHRAFTDSIGFCFGRCESRNCDLSKETLEDFEYDAEFAWKYLNGALPIDPEIVCIFEADDKFAEENIKEGYGIYADPYGGFFDTMKVKEYSCTSYSKKDFKLIAYCTNFVNSYESIDFEWEWVNLI